MQRWRKAKDPPNTPKQGTLNDIPSVAEGELVKLPKLQTLQNNYVDLSALKEKYLLGVFVSTECAGCTQDAQFWKDLRQEISKKAVAFYVISLDVDRERVEKFVKAYSLGDLPILFDPQREALTSFNIHFVPQYILLTREGRVSASWKGLRRYDPKQKDAVDKLEGLRKRFPETLSQLQTKEAK